MENGSGALFSKGALPALAPSAYHPATDAMG